MHLFKSISATLAALALAVTLIQPAVADSPPQPSQRPHDLQGCVQAWTGVLQNGSAVQAGLNAILQGVCNMPQQLGYIVPNNVTPPGLNCALQACPLQGLTPGSTAYVMVPPPFQQAILTPWGQLPPTSPSPGEWVMVTNGMEHSGNATLVGYATFLRFWSTGDGCRLASLQRYPQDNPAYHCSALGDY